ncbi:hypothetical protein CYFUS_002296 [Cystobacter fuscus]|uniref:Cytochrome P450 n=1 Tax=Cystobacter fuscus TaxID=43 RepID=A0A250J0E5_9BACT|nr:cytochrome P450 [Cystobacter fuscus]ATB36881.1 hypothetical protein CYFUS_002296 [Cystobacter fuscus]
MKAFAGIPGPAPSLPLGNAQDFIGRLPWEVCARYAERHGGMLVVWLLGAPTIILTDPELIWQVLEGDFDSYYKTSPRKQFLPIITDASEFIANGAEWKKKRETDPAHNAIGPRGYEIDAHAVREALTQKVRALVEATRGEPLEDVVPVIARLAFDALSIQAVGRLLEDEIFDTFQTLTKVGTDRINLPVPLPFALAGARARERWQARFESLVREIRQSPGAGRSVLHATLRVGTQLDERALATQIGNIYFGGMTSITSSVIHTLYLLTRHPDVRARVVAEVRELATRELDPALEVFESYPEFNRVVLESLRVLPPVPIYSRCSSPDRQVSLGGHVLPPNTDLLLTCWPLHRSARHWKDPERFEPDRWKGNTLAENPLGSGYFFPFGRGRRACAGSALGLLNIKMLLVSLLTASLPEVGAHQEYRGKLFFGAMHPKGMRVRFLPMG